jgi:predicted transcriptional regulator of viral defense system
MRSIDALSALGTLHKPVITTAEASAVWNMAPPSASKALSRLATAHVVQRVGQGVWAMGSTTPDVYEIAPVLTRPYPNYVSMYSALFRHAMIDQIPRSVDLMSLGRPMKVATSVSLFTVHHIHEDSFDGFAGQTAIRSGLATAEKALVDTVMILGVRNGSVTLPEIDLPEEFDIAAMWKWVEKISSTRLKTITTRNLVRLLEQPSPV